MLDLSKAITFASLDRRPAVVVAEPDGSRSGWVLNFDEDDWSPINPAVIDFKADEIMSREDFFEIFGEYMPPE